jgi:Bifunctional DNA primase/polymerase, N-terminal/YspA, cpYpsA-related SLOG family
VTASETTILVSGGRDWPHGDRLAAVLDHAAGGEQVRLLVGDCPTGADEYARGWAVRRGVPAEVISARWEQMEAEGKPRRAAGPLRNLALLDRLDQAEGQRQVLAFHEDLGRSRGTRQCIAAARRRGYPVTLVGPTTRQLLPADTRRGLAITDATPPGQAALIYAGHGIPVLPLRGKLPRIPKRAGGRGVHDATCDPDMIRAWWRLWPDANIGLRCGIAFDVIDVEIAGRQSLERFLAGGGGQPIGGPRVRTGSGGWHLYVEPTGLRDKIGVLEHVDYRAADRYVVAPPSRHPETGRPYRWVQGREVGTSLGLVPEALRELLAPSARTTRDPVAAARPTASGHPYGLAALQGECAELAAAPKGERNRQLWESARNLYNLVGGGVLDEVQVDHAIRAAAQQCGLLEEEPRQTEATLASARKVGLAHPRGIPDRARSAGADASPGRRPRLAPERPPER